MNSPDHPDGSKEQHSEPEESDEIINDLESIKHLLNEEDAQGIPTLDAAADADEEVPLLDDQVEGGVTIDEGMPDETFKTLLGDAWQDSVEELFNDARSQIEEHSTAWLPEHTDELSDALKIRIDASVRAWLAETLQANIALLRERIVTELSTELLAHLHDKLGHKQGDTPILEEKEPDHG